MRFRRGWPVALAVAFAALQMHAAVTLRPLFLRDTTTAWLPLAETFVHCLGEGSLPLWDPYAGFGRPLLADPRAAVLYPFTWLNMVLGPAAYYALFAIVHIALGGVGVWCLARLFGVSRAAALTAAGVWMAGGPFLSLVAMWSHLVGAAYVPWLVWAFARLAERTSGRRVVAAGGLLALQVCGGSPEMTGLAALGTLAVIAMPPRSDLRPRTRRQVVALAASALLGLGLAAPQWLPTLDVMGRSQRQAAPRGTGPLVWSLHPVALPELVVPARWIEQSLTEQGLRDVAGSREPFLRSIYVGAVAALLVAVALCRRRREAAAPLAMALAGTVLALGSFTPVYRAATGWVPIVAAFRYPVKALVLAALGWSLLAGIGLDRLRAGGRRERATAAGAAATLALVLAGVALALRGQVGLPEGLRTWIAAPVPPAGVPFAVALTALAAGGVLALRPGRTALALGALACVDLTYRHWQLNPSGDPIVWRARPESLAALDRAQLARTYVHDPAAVEDDPSVLGRSFRLARVLQGLSPSEGMMMGVQEALLPPLGSRWRVFGSFDRDIAEFDPVPIAQLREDFLRASPAGQLALLRLAGVRNVASLLPRPLGIQAPPAAIVPGYFADPVRVFRVEDARPRAFVVDGVRVGDGAAALIDPSFAGESDVLLPAGDPRPSTGAVGRAAVTRFACNAVSVEVDAARPARLVLLDAWDPGWRARVDGASAPVARANVAFRSVEVPAGRHTVEWRYVPRGLAAGCAIALAAVGITLGVLLRRAPDQR